MAIARKSHVAGWWAGWVPVVNFMVLCSAAKASHSCFWSLVLPLAAVIAGSILWIPVWIAAWIVLGTIAWTAIWMRICHERGRSKALGLLAPVPVLNLVLFGVLAFGD